MHDLVSITPFDLIGSDERGITAKFKLPRTQADFLFLTRKAQSVSGNTYHEGNNSGTNPKLFILASGTIKLTYRKVGTTSILEEVIAQPSLIQICPYVIHKIEVINDSILIECNSIEDIQKDRIKECV